MSSLVEKAIQIAADIEKAEARFDSIEKEVKLLQKRRDELQDSSDKEARQLIVDARREANRITHEATVLKEHLLKREWDIELKEKALANFPEQVEKFNRRFSDAEKQSASLKEYASNLSAKEDSLAIREQQIILREKQLGVQFSQDDSSKKEKPSKKKEK